MAQELQDGTGSGSKQKVNSNNRAYTNAITQTSAEAGTALGNSYNINTGIIALTGTANSAVIYLKNNENSDLIVTAIAVGLFARSATVTDTSLLTIVRNPTGGTITAATPDDVDMNQNRNFGDSKTLTVDAYKGTDGDTLTGGNNIAQLLIPEGRSFFSIDWTIPKGDTIGALLDLNTSGGADMYIAIICHLKDSNE